MLKNGEGYIDPTAHQAIKKTDRAKRKGGVMREGLLCYGEGACPENCELLMAHGCYTKLHMDAAAAIEALEAEVKRLEPKRKWAEMAQGVEFGVYDEDTRKLYDRLLELDGKIGQEVQE